MQQIIKKMLIAGGVLMGVSAWCIIPGQPLERKKIEQVIKRNKVSYVNYIKSLASDWYWYQALRPVAGIFARVNHTKSELKHAEAAGAFFENKMRVEKEARAIGTQERDIDYLVNLITCYRQQGSKKGDLPRILHEKNIEDLLLPADVSPATLKKYPDKLSKLVKTGKISDQRYYRNVALNIFVHYLVVKKLLP
ncbi:MAG TPA: hypothetical protein ENI08_01955 [Candidatus Dependentiae bacterium]|nr:hypothetical protein [Candidatus Dependentiae bacterium]